MCPKLSVRDVTNTDNEVTPPPQSLIVIYTSNYHGAMHLWYQLLPCMVKTHIDGKGRAMGGAMESYFLLSLDTLPERRMVDNTVAATDYQRQRRGRALAESFVMTAEGIGFGKRNSGVDIES